MSLRVRIRLSTKNTRLKRYVAIIGLLLASLVSSFAVQPRLHEKRREMRKSSNHADCLNLAAPATVVVSGADLEFGNVGRTSGL